MNQLPYYLTVTIHQQTLRERVQRAEQERLVLSLGSLRRTRIDALLAHLGIYMVGLGQQLQARVEHRRWKAERAMRIASLQAE